MNSESSGDENLELLREAADNEFFSNDLYNHENRKTIPKNVHQQIHRPSLRHPNERIENGLNLTPEYQKFVAMKLMELMDSQIKEVDVPSQSKSNSNCEGGIRLFASSSNLVNCEENENLRSVPKRRKRKSHRVGDVDKVPEDIRCKEAAVSAEWILSQEAVAGWEPDSKGVVEVFTKEEVIIKANMKKQVQEEKEEKEEKKRIKKSSDVKAKDVSFIKQRD